MGIWDFLSGPVKGVIDGVRGIIDDVSTTEEEKLEANRQLVDLQQSFQTEILDAQAKFIENQASVIKTEMESDSWMARSWRPILMLVFTYIIFHIHVLAPVFDVPTATIPDQMWTLLNIGVGGYIGGRTVEKTVGKLRNK